MEPVWIEVALNGGAGRQRQPNIPVSPQEIISEGILAAQAGAAVVHVHVYDPATEKPVESADLYRRVIEGIREQTNAIVYPTIALGGSLKDRFTAVEELAKLGLLEWTALDPGSVNIVHRAQAANNINGFVYSTPDDHIRHGLSLSAQYGFHASFAIYEPGFARLGKALSDSVRNLPQPIYRIMLSTDYLFGLPPETFAIDTYDKVLSHVAHGAPKMVSVLGGDVMSVAEKAISSGFYLRVGLEDASLGCERTNIELIEEAVGLVSRLGGTPATPDQIRQTLGSTHATG